MDPYLDTAPCGFVTFSDEGDVLLVNKTLSGWVGFTPDQLVGQNIESIFTIPSRIFYNTHFFPLIKLHAKAEEIFLSLRTRSNESIPVLANAHRKFENGRYVNHCVFVQVKKRKEYEQEILDAKRQAERALTENSQLHQLARSLEERTLALDRHLRQQVIQHEDLLKFSKIISHDVLEPVRKIQVFADLIGRDQEVVLNARCIRLLKKIDNAARRIRTLTYNLHQYITLDTEEPRNRIDLRLVVDAAKARAIESRQFDDFEMTVEGNEEIDGNVQQLELMFFHLIDNAIQFRESTRRLKIQINAFSVDENLYRVYKDKYKFANHLCILFSDNGRGFNTAHKEYIFELLNKEDAGSKGMGVGLSFVKKIVENHMGTLAVDTKEGAGTTFTIYLPMSISAVAKKNEHSD